MTTNEAAPPPSDQDARASTSRRPPPQGQSAARQGGPALEACYRFLVWLLPVLSGFARSHKFQLGDRIQQHALDVQELLIRATYRKPRAELLGEANLKLEMLRYGMRLAHDLQQLDHRRYEHAAREIDAIGRLVGAWIKTNQQSAPSGPAVAA